MHGVMNYMGAGLAVLTLVGYGLADDSNILSGELTKLKEAGIEGQCAHW